MYKNTLSDVNKKICILYLKKYEEKDIKIIEKMFSDDIVLRDWKIRVEGKEKALGETLKILNQLSQYKLTCFQLMRTKTL